MAAFTAISIVGVRIDSSTIPKIKEKVKQKAFPHDYPQTDNFHPKSGKPLWTDKLIEVDTDYEKYVFEDTSWNSYESEKEGLNEQSFVDGKLTTTLLSPYEGIIRCYVDDESEDSIYYIGLILNGTSDDGPFEEHSVIAPDLEECLKKFLEPYGLWNESNYGLYSILHCSC